MLHNKDMFNGSESDLPTKMETQHLCTSAAVIINNLQHFLTEASTQLGLNWASLVILATLASPQISYLSCREIIQTTGLDRCWVYRKLRILTQRGLIDSVQQRISPNQKRALYAVNGKGRFYLTQALTANGVRTIKAYEARSVE
jgi:hypothetical protein